jgi:glutaredoxin
MKQRLLSLIASFCLLAPAGCRTADVAHPVARELHHPSIVVYTRSGCSYCRKVEKYFAARQIPFTERDIGRDPAALRDYRERYHGEIVPLIVFGNDERIVDGYDLPAIRGALRTFGLPADD